MDLAEIVIALRDGQTFEAFAEAVGVSHAAIRAWENGSNVSPWNRIRLLNYAKNHDAPSKIIKALEAAQAPEAPRP